MRLVRLGVEPPQIVAEPVYYARTFWDQLRGLIGSNFPTGAALVIPNCPQVHTAFLRRPITVAFARAEKDGSWRILHQETLSPWRVSRWVSGATVAIEMPTDRPVTPLVLNDLVRVDK